MKNLSGTRDDGDGVLFGASSSSCAELFAASSSIAGIFISSSVLDDGWIVLIAATLLPEPGAINPLRSRQTKRTP
jgi:hypothetical protein